MKAGHHAQPLDPDGLDHKDDNQNRNQSGKENVAEEDPQFAPEPPPPRCIAPQGREILDDLNVRVILRGDAKLLLTSHTPTNRIATRYEPDTNQIRTEYQPNANQIPVEFRSSCGHLSARQAAASSNNRER